MLRLLLSLLLSVALHLAGWQLFGMAQPVLLGAAYATVQAPEPPITAVFLAPAAVAQSAPSLPVAPPKAALPSKPVAVKTFRPALAAQAKPAPLPATVKQTVARPAPADVVSAQAAAAPAQVESARPARPASAAVAAEVLSRKPSFREPPRQPSYPSQARRRNQQGVVLLEVRLDALGQQRSLNVLRSSGVESLDRAALQAVAAWRFNPETTDGQAVPSRVHIPIQFALTASR
ncbi:TonB family protein [Pseudomonas sp. LjRoot71]|uniref:energy transducer TonB n=1 Tax=Pseudomonas sp. LjRoot71 TaxID=3342336 RepID=UPI003ED0725A